MKKSKLSLLMCGLALIGLSTTACSQSSTQKDTAPTESQIAEKNWTKYKTISFDTGTFKIKKIIKVRSYTFGMIEQLVVTGTYTNKLDEPYKPSYFIGKHLNFYEVDSKTRTELTSGSAEDENSPYNDLVKNSSKEVLPDKSIECAYVYIPKDGFGSVLPKTLLMEITDSHYEVLYKKNMTFEKTEIVKEK